MIAPAELAARHTDLTAESFAHLQRLMGSWGVLSDLSFSDLLLLVPLRGSVDGELVVLGQIRPSTGATLIRVDLVGHIVDAGDWPGVERSIRNGTIALGDIFVSSILPPSAAAPNSVAAAAGSGASGGHGTAGSIGRYPSMTGEVPAIEDRAKLECLPVPWRGTPVAVVARVGPLAERRTGRLERVYRDLYRRLAGMILTGDFPYPGEEVVSEHAPRVGDGLLVADPEGRISYLSPNAMSALHRMGVSEAVEGRRLSELGIEETAIETAIASGRPVIEEIERRPDVIVLVHCTPLVEERAVTGAMVLLRDVTDLRRLDRLLLSKDAAIREVHHRVKNNLQTISSLLRLQARRLDPGEGRQALLEAERRVRSIAVVHEILSREPGDQVSFGEIVEAVVHVAEDSVVSGREVRITVEGDAGDLPADVVTPLAVALAELLQNAIEHAFSVPGAEPHAGEPAGPGEPCAAKLPPGNVRVFVSNDGQDLMLRVEDDGRGLPPGFGIDNTTSLGLSIVRDLVQSQLGGTITMESRAGTVVTVEVPLVSGSGPGVA